MEVKITAIIITRNEEIDLESCLTGLKWCDELIVVDDNSTDKTVEIAKKFKATIHSHSIKNDFSSQRNFGLSKAKGDWVLFVDADERISDALSFEISNIVHQTIDQTLRKYNGFYIKRNDFMWGKRIKFGESGSMKFLRLAKKNAGIWEGKVHEKWKIKGHLGHINNPILHFPHKTLKEFLSEINLYTTIRAEELNKEGHKANFISILMYPSGKFIFNYFLKRGFLDGVAGIVLAIIMSFHSFFVRGKLWLINNKNES